MVIFHKLKTILRRFSITRPIITHWSLIIVVYNKDIGNLSLKLLNDAESDKSDAFTLLLIKNNAFQIILREEWISPNGKIIISYLVNLKALPISFMFHSSGTKRSLHIKLKTGKLRMN